MTKDEYYAQKKAKAATYAANNAAYAKRKAAWELKSSGGFVPLEEGTYTIDIPGARDIFKLPLGYMQDKQLKRERYNRFKTAKTPIPKSLQWITQVITMTDNAQDLLFCAWFLAKPLLRRLPARFIPFVGWAMIPMDILNIITTLGGFALSPGLSKPCMRKTVNNYRQPKKLARNIFRAAVAPLGWRGWLSFALQAPQALESLTGYGMVLGTIMGAVSNAVWSVPRMLSGDKIVVRGLPPSDPISKAFNYLTSDVFTHNMRDIFTPEEHIMLMMAHNAAIGIILDSGIPLNLERSETIQDLPVPTFEPWDLTTLEILEEEGIDLQEPQDHFTTIKNPTWDQYAREAITEYPAWGSRMKEIANEEDYNRWSTVYQVYNEAAYDTLEVATGVPKDTFLIDDNTVIAVEELASLDMMPLVPPSQEQIQNLVQLAMLKAEARSAAFPTSEDWKSSIEEICGPVISKVQRITEDLVWKP